MLTLARPHGPVDEPGLAALELELGSPLPAAYRSWLGRAGGGFVGRDLVVPGTGGNGILNELYGAARLPAAQRRTGMSRVIPGGYLLIGDGAGGVLALRTGPDHQGSVWWADFDLADELGADGPTEKIMRPLAADLESFLNSLGGSLS